MNNNDNTHSIIYFRLTNGIDWEYVFYAKHQHQFETGCQLAWQKYNAKFYQQIMAAKKWINDEIREIDNWYSEKSSNKTLTELNALNGHKLKLISDRRLGKKYGKKIVDISRLIDSLELHAKNPDVHGEWVSSGHYRLNGVINVPPTPHTVYRKNNDFSGLYLAATLSAKHASQMSKLTFFTSE